MTNFRQHTKEQLVLDDNNEKKSSSIWEGVSRLILGRRKVTEEVIQEIIDA